MSESNNGVDWRPQESDSETEMRIRWESFLCENPSLDDATAWLSEYGYRIVKLKESDGCEAVGGRFVTVDLFAISDEL